MSDDILNRFRPAHFARRGAVEPPRDESSATAEDGRTLPPWMSTPAHEPATVVDAPTSPSDQVADGQPPVSTLAWDAAIHRMASVGCFTVCPSEDAPFAIHPWVGGPVVALIESRWAVERFVKRHPDLLDTTGVLLAKAWPADALACLIQVIERNQAQVAVYDDSGDGAVVPAAWAGREAVAAGATLTWPESGVIDPLNIVEITAGPHGPLLVARAPIT